MSLYFTFDYAGLTFLTGIRTEGDATEVTNNLVALSIWPGAYLDRVEPLNIEYEGAIEAVLATDLVLVNNTVAGAERLAYHVPGQLCTTLDSDLWSNNRGSGALIGEISTCCLSGAS